MCALCLLISVNGMIRRFKIFLVVFDFLHYNVSTENCLFAY